MSEIPKIVLGERTSLDPSEEAVTDSGQDGPNKNVQCKVQSCVKDRKASGRKSTGDTTQDTPLNDDKDVDGGDDERRDSVGLTPGHMPIRSSSDIGLPATSMPNLALSLMAGGGAGVGSTGTEAHLGVYCSPRASRRSVDLEVTAAREEARAGGGGGGGASCDLRYNWSSQYDSLDFGSPGGTTIVSSAVAPSSSGCNTNTLRVLTSSSRAASALSLTSDCTARSIGLLSNDGDSDSDADASLMSDAGQQGHGHQLLPSSRDPVKASGGTAQLRRYLSHPEESVAVPGSASDVSHARPSVSLCNIKSAEASLADPVDASRAGSSGKHVTSSMPHSVTLELDGSPADNRPEDCVETPAQPSPHNSAHTAANIVTTDSSVATVSAVKPVTENKSSSKKLDSNRGASLASYGGGGDGYTIPPSLQDGSLHARTRRADAEERMTFSCRGSGTPSSGEGSSQRILSYKCDPNDNSRNGRIRQWLQDMDKLDLSTG